MKLLFNLSLILLSTGCLFAQTNQVIGCRLQIIGTNQNTDINQIADYRLQVAGSKVTELPSENQISQRVKATTNYELQTANCNNSGIDLSCYLMMNPAIEDAEEAIEKLIIGETRPSSSIISNSLEMGEGEKNIVECFLPHTTASLTASSNQNSKVFSEVSEDQEEPTVAQKLGDDILGKYSVNPSVECARESTNHQSGLSNLNQRIDRPSLQPIASIRPVGRIVDILALPAGLIGVFLRSSEVKYVAYKAEHQQAVQELQEKYPSLTYPELAQKIVVWKRAVAEWSECLLPEEKEALYQKVEALVADMPSEFYRLVALSQAMKIIEDATAYSRYLPLAVEKYDKDADIEGTEEAKIAAVRAKTYFLSKLDIVNNNIKKLEEAAEAVIRLSEQRSRCFVATATVVAKENAEITEDLQNAVRTAEKAILSYCQFGQKMKEGDSTAAYFFRIEGFSLECDALKQECRAQEAINYDDAEKWMDFNQADCYVETAAVSLKNAVQARSEGELEVAKAHERVAQYNFQAAQAIDSGDSWDSLKVKIFSDAACQARYVIEPLKDAAQARNEGQVEAAIIYEQAAQYRCQLVQAIANGDSWDNSKVRSLPTAACQAYDAARSLKNKAKAISEGQVKIAEVYEEKAQYYFKAVQAALKGDREKVDGFSNGAGKIFNAVGPLKDAAQARSEGQVEVAIIYEQAAQYYLEAAQAVANGDRTKEKKYSTAAEHTIDKADNLKHAILARGANQVEAAKVFDQAAQYYSRSVQFSIDEDSTNAENFSFLAKKTFLAARSLKNAYLARSANQEEEAKALDQAAQYYCRSVQCFIDGGNTTAENILFLAKNTSLAALSLKNADLARNVDQVEVAKAFHQVAQYYFQAVQASVEGNSIKAENFLHAGKVADWAGKIFKETAQATIHETQNFRVLSMPPYSRFQLLVLENDMVEKENFQTRAHAQSQEQLAYYFLRKAEVYAQEGIEKGNAYKYSANRTNS